MFFASRPLPLSGPYLVKFVPYPDADPLLPLMIIAGGGGKRAPIFWRICLIVLWETECFRLFLLVKKAR